MEWQPIETAPVATQVLMVWRPVDHLERPFHREITTGVRCHDEKTYLPNGQTYSGGRYYDEKVHITHWMPLPPLPPKD